SDSGTVTVTAADAAALSTMKVTLGSGHFRVQDSAANITTQTVATLLAKGVDAIDVNDAATLSLTAAQALALTLSKSAAGHIQVTDTGAAISANLAALKAHGVDTLQISGSGKVLLTTSQVADFSLNPGASGEFQVSDVAANISGGALTTLAAKGIKVVTVTDAGEVTLNASEATTSGVTLNRSGGASIRVQDNTANVNSVGVAAIIAKGINTINLTDAGTLTVDTLANQTLSFKGDFHGSIVQITGTGTVAIPLATAQTVASFAGTGTGANAAHLSITGLTASSDLSALSISALASGGLTAIVDTSSGNVAFTGNLGAARLSLTGTGTFTAAAAKLDGRIVTGTATVAISDTTISANTDLHSVATALTFQTGVLVANGVTLTLGAAQANGKTIGGSGAVVIADTVISSSADLHNISAGLVLQSGLSVSAGQTLTLSFAEANGRTIIGSGTVALSGTSVTANADLHSITTSSTSLSSGLSVATGVTLVLSGEQAKALVGTVTKAAGAHLIISDAAANLSSSAIAAAITHGADTVSITDSGTVTLTTAQAQSSLVLLHPNGGHFQVSDTAANFNSVGLGTLESHGVTDFALTGAGTLNLGSGAGSANVIGSSGNDTYVAAGTSAGTMTISDTNGINVLDGSAVGEGGLRGARQSGNDLIIELNGNAGGGELVIKNQFAGTGAGIDHIHTGGGQNPDVHIVGSVATNVSPHGGVANFVTGDGHQEMSVADAADLTMGNAVTIEAWINPTSTANNQILMKGEYGYAIGLNGGHIEYWVDGSQSNTIKSTGTVSTNAWTHIAVVVDKNANTTSFYIDGVLSNTINSAVINNNSGPLYIGQQTSGAYNTFAGQIDEVRLWNKALSGAEVTANHNAAPSSNSAGLVADWTFGEGGGTTTADATGNGHTATLGAYASLSGHDVVSTLTGTTGEDIIVGNLGEATLIGNGGEDTFFVGGGSQKVIGDGSASANNGGDITGGKVSFTFAGNSVTASLVSGSATITSGTSVWTDTLTNITDLEGSAGNDVLTGRANGYSELEGGAGNNTISSGGGMTAVSYRHALSGVTVNLGSTTFMGVASGSALNGYGGTDTLWGVRGVRGSSSADYIHGGDVGGNYELRGGGGADYLEGGTADTRFRISTTDNATVIGHGGHDSIIFDDFLSGTLTGSAFTHVTGIETLQVNGSTGLQTVVLDSITAGEGITSVDGYGSSNGLVVNASSQSGAVTLHGGSGSDTFTGGSGNDFLDGGTGTDKAIFHGAMSGYKIGMSNGTVTVQDINPTLNGNDGTDSLTGIETLQFTDGNVSVNAPSGQSGMASLKLAGATGSGISLTDNHTGHVTLEVWVKFNTLPTSGLPGNVFGRTNSWNSTTQTEDNIGGYTNTVSIDPTTHTLISYVAGGGSTTGSQVIQAGVWYHIAQTMDVGGNTQLYVNGVADGGAIATPSEYTDETNVIFGSAHHTMAAMDSQYASIAIWDSARTPSQVQADMNSSLGPTSGLVGLWVPSSATGGLISDLSGYGTSASTHNATVVAASLPTLSGSAGDDVLNVSSGYGVIDGGAGNDVVKMSVTDFQGVSTLLGGAGSDQLQLSGSGALTDANLGILSGVETLGLSGAGAIAMTVGSLAAASGLVTIDATASSGSISVNAAQSSANLTVAAGSGSDYIIGGSGADTLTVGSGSVFFDGGAGANKAIFSGNKANYTIGTDGGGHLTVTNTGTGQASTLANVGMLQFADQSASLPTISSVSYDAATGKLTLAGSNLALGASFHPTALTLTGDSGVTYALTGGTLDVASTSSAAVLQLSAQDMLAVNGLLNKAGTAANDPAGTAYNLAASAGWDGLSGAIGTASVTVSNAGTPTITSVAYNTASGVLTVTGSNFSNHGANGGVLLGDLTLFGSGGSSHTLGGGSISVASPTSFSLTLTGTDAAWAAAHFDVNGPKAGDGVSYALLADSGWDGGLIKPFNGATIVDGNSGDTVSATITLPSANGILTGAGLVDGGVAAGIHTYSLAGTTIAGLQSALHGLVFNPANASYDATSFGLKISGLPVSTTLVSGLNSPTQIGVDGAGNLYYQYSDGSGHYLVAERTTAGATVSLPNPTGTAVVMTVDQNGDVFYLDGDWNAQTFDLKEIVAGSNSVTTLHHYTGMQMGGIAADPSGQNVYFYDYTYHNIYKYNVAGATSTTNNVSTFISAPAAMFIDNSGAIYVADNNHNYIDKLTWGAGGTISADTILGNPLKSGGSASPSTVAVD
ncbi:MAG: hypothetical protein HY055_14610, partial [Magnetospirillum sp.]|nr:hypothetical protein [Magnetospirillum sp.]